MTMENTPPAQHTSSHHSSDANTSGRKRSGSGGSILSKFPFLRASDSKSSLNDSRSQQSSTTTAPATSESTSARPPRALAAAISQQQKTRKRKGSLRKVALLGRGAAREKRELKLQPQSPPLAIDTSQIILQQTAVPPPIHQPYADSNAATNGPGIGLGLSDDTPRPSMEGFARRGVAVIPANSPLPAPELDSQMTSPTISYTSTTDEEEGLTMSLHVPSPLRPNLVSLSSGSESYFHGSSHRAPSPAHSIQRRRSTSKQQRAKSPLSLQGLATGSPALATMDGGDHDYSETEWWGWVVLIVTWFVFILGMGSCLNIWSWAWDVGSTPYAPPELEDDPTLPIVGYYPALLILTSIMAWVWVIVAWVGMKYFRHAKISGD
ncbi:hypothetical protein F5Y19DRAFT_450588 [Xylariaceae sp. FL1651]|nr:hypothetical protein F5Y19DRAFT_450588 [Xylariaceae sp. FL1651]